MSSEGEFNDDELPMADIAWDIRRAGRGWSGDEAMARFALTPEKFEMLGGKLFWSDAERMTLLGLLLENVGVDAALRLGDPDVWRRAIRDLA
jgi:hypothetical protein